MRTEKSASVSASEERILMFISKLSGAILVACKKILFPHADQTIPEGTLIEIFCFFSSFFISTGLRKIHLFSVDL